MDLTTQADRLRDIETKGSVVVTWPVIAESEELVLTGVSDAVVFQRAKRTHVIELKMTRGDPMVAFRRGRVPEAISLMSGAGTASERSVIEPAKDDRFEIGWLG